MPDNILESTQPRTYERAETYYNREMVPYLSPLLVARQLFRKVIEVPSGKTAMYFDRVKDMSDAIVTFSIPDDTNKADFVGFENETVNLAYVSKTWKIAQDKLRAFYSEGKDLPTVGMEAAVKKIGKADNQMLIQSWSPNSATAKINGLFAAAGNTLLTSYSFGTPTNPTDAVSDGVSMALDDDITGVNWNLVVGNTAFGQARKSRLTQSDVKEWPDIIDALNPNAGQPKGTILMSKNIPANKGLLVPVDPAGLYISLLEGMAPQNVIGTDSKIGRLSPVYGTTLELVGPWIKEADSIVVLNAI